MNKSTIFKGAAVAAALVAVSGVSATAASQITASDLSTGAANHRVIKDGSIHQNDLTAPVRSLLHRSSEGPKGDPGTPGAKGDKGDPGDSYLAGAYVSVAKYDVGDTNAGAIATVACKTQADVAISGGVQTLGLDANANSRNTPVGSSFAGRMDWSTNTPFPNRLDGWIVQFAGNAGATSDKDPLKVNVYAVCVPGLSLSTETTYTESAD